MRGFEGFSLIRCPLLNGALHKVARLVVFNNAKRMHTL